MPDNKTTIEQDHLRATNIIKSVWSLLSEVSAPLSEHQKRAASLEWLTTRIDKLLDLETPKKADEDSK